MHSYRFESGHLTLSWRDVINGNATLRLGGESIIEKEPGMKTSSAINPKTKMNSHEARDSIDENMRSLVYTY